MRQAPYQILFLFFPVFLFSSCNKGQDNTLTVLTALDRSLVTSSLNIESSNNTIYNAISSRANERSTVERAKVWQAKALMIKSLSDKAYHYLERLKKEIKEQAGARIENGKEIFEKSNRNAASVIYNKSGEELLKRLNEYKTQVMQVDPELRNEFENTIPMHVPEIKDRAEFKNSYFKNSTAISALASLSSFQNEIRNTENELISFCLNNIDPVRIVDPFISLLVNQSSSVVKKDETITITAGIGIFSAEPGPVFSIAGQKILPKPDGSAVYKLKAASRPGKYKIPVKAAYFKPDGTKAWQETEITYEVVKYPGD